jgi:midasin (ATPase involved in ribosome maturation)
MSTVWMFSYYCFQQSSLCLMYILRHKETLVWLFYDRLQKLLMSNDMIEWLRMMKCKREWLSDCDVFQRNLILLQKMKRIITIYQSGKSVWGRVFSLVPPEEKPHVLSPEITFLAKLIKPLLFVTRNFTGSHSSLVRFQVLTAASMKMAVFWVVAPCSLV